MRGWRAEKRKPVVSAILAERGGRLSARHMRSRFVRYRASRYLSAWRSFGELRAHVICGVLNTAPGLALVRSVAHSRADRAFSQLLAGTRSGPGRSPAAPECLDAIEARGRRTPSRDQDAS
jgi:hypothetical protein